MIRKSSQTQLEKKRIQSKPRAQSAIKNSKENGSRVVAKKDEVCKSSHQEIKIVGFDNLFFKEQIKQSLQDYTPTPHIGNILPDFPTDEEDHQPVIFEPKRRIRPINYA